MKILAVSSSGGVLLDLLALRAWFDRHNVIWVAVRAPDTEAALAGEIVFWAPECDRSAPWSVARTVYDSCRLLRNEKPNLLVSAGTGVAIGYFIAAKLIGVRSIWIETLNVVEAPGRVARLCSRLAAATLVQREVHIAQRSRAVFIGELY